MKNKDPYFTEFIEPTEHFALPNQLTDPFSTAPHPLCKLASSQLQNYLKEQTEWEHNFGFLLSPSDYAKQSIQNKPIIGKMFGVLLVTDKESKLGFLSAFSGKLAGGNRHSRFVPPVFDGLSKGSFVNIGMTALTDIINEIKALENRAVKTTDDESKAELRNAIAELKKARKIHSIDLQEKIFRRYIFLNQRGAKKSLHDIFLDFANQKPPSGAGECTAPKLLQYSFAHKMKPLAIAEFWWGQSPKSVNWKHKHYYPACQEKCAPILDFMLDGLI
ncbi:MAG: tRNA pseudouridine32 synthase/23S rRNA pseudouridine746 synthase [Limisphaerales bacterium]